MADLNSLPIIGDWRIVIQSKNAGWAQRVVAKGTATGDIIIDGTVGGSRDVFGNGTAPWQLVVQHNDGVNGWQDNWVRPAVPSIGPGSITQIVESEDKTTPGSDRDFDDLVIRLEKLGMVDLPARPFAVLPRTMQMMPDGIFETTFGRYFMGVRVRNIWTRHWPTWARVGLTPRSRSWLQAAGVRVIDDWSSEDAQAFGQDVAAGRVLVEGLAPWETRTVYFKVDVTDAHPRKHMVEVQVSEPVSHVHPRARAPMLVTRTRYDAVNRVFVSECDRGRMTAAIRELAVDFNTLKRAVFRARELFAGGGGGGSGTSTGGTGGGKCADAERLRQELIALLQGKDVNVCDLWRRIQCCCAGGGGTPGGGGDGPWVGAGGTGMEILCMPTLVDYRVDYTSPFGGQYGPIPFDDPLWKIILLIVAAVLALGAAGSAAADLAYHSNDVVIGKVARTVLNTRVDAAVARLNGNRSLTDKIFSFLDAAPGEENTVPVDKLDGRIDVPGTIMTNAQIDAATTALMMYKTDPAVIANARVFKSGARTGITFGLMERLVVVPRDKDKDGKNELVLVDQLRIMPDPAHPNDLSEGGDSGSLWIHFASRAIVGLHHSGAVPGTNTAHASRIEDVMSELKIRFA